MSSDMPRVWWSPSLAAAEPGTPLAGLLWSFVSGEYVEPSNLPPDAVELKPVSDAPTAPVEAATTIEWRLTADDTFSHLHAAWTFDNEAAARMFLADLDVGRYRNLKLEYRTVHRSVWVTDDV